MVGISKIAAILAVCAAAVASCTPSAPTLIGAWRVDPVPTEPPTTLLLNPDQTFTLESDSDPAPEVRGTYSLNGNEITFRNFATDGGIPLDPSPGKYRYELSPGSVRFTRLDDHLESRVRDFSRGWARNR